MVIQQEASYSSPYSIGTLDTVPPAFLQLLVSLGPLLGWIRQVTDTIQWYSPPRHSLLLLLLWNVVCLWPWPVLVVLVPGTILYKLGADWLRCKTSRTRRDRLEQARHKQHQHQQQQRTHHDDDDDDDDHEDDDRLLSQRRQQQQEAEQEELIARKIQPEGQVSLDDTLDNVTAILGFTQRLGRSLETVRLEWLDGSRPEVVVATLAVMGYVIPLWCLGVLVLGVGGTLAWMGSAALLAYSPWTPVVWMAIRRHAVLRYGVAVLWAYSVAFITSWQAFNPLATTAQKSSATTNKKPWTKWWAYVWHRAGSEKDAMVARLSEEDLPKDSTRNEMVFQFEIYENQRWWLGANWTTNMLSTERGPWTDNHLVAITSKEQFKLPQAVEKTTAGDKWTRKTWSWADNDWWVDMTGELDGKVDHGGWEYGNNAWQHMTGLPAIQTFTRRRRWCRRALLVEHRTKSSPTSPPQTSGLRHRS